MRYSIKELRARNNFTQLDMAKKLGISLQSYNSWENNFAKLSIIKAQKVASILNVEIEDIFFDSSLENLSSE